jgi:hypothetical protein
MKILKARFSYLLLAVFCVALIYGCSTTAIYQKHTKETDGLGYQDITVNDSTYRVKFWGSESNSEESVNDAAMYRVAEFTAQKGYDYFIILDDMKSMVKRGEHMTDFYSTNPAPGKTDYSTVIITGPVRTKTFAIGKGPVPNTDGAFSAKDVMGQYAGKIKHPTD